MKSTDNIQVHELLLQRQELFAQVWELEQEIHALSENQFKIPEVPVDLPSSEKKSRKATKKQANSTNIKAPSLPDTDHFYLLISRDHQWEYQEIIESRPLLMARLNLASKARKTMAINLATYDDEGFPQITENFWSLPDGL
jgi:hypothetical protein